MPKQRGELRFVAFDEVGRMWAADMSMNKRHIVAATSISCTWCGAESGEACRNAPIEQARFGIQHVHGVHGARVKDAELAQATMERLIGED